MKPRLNAIEIILRSFIHYQTNYSLFFYPLPSLKFGGELSGANCPGGELSGIPEFAECHMITLGMRNKSSVSTAKVRDDPTENFVL